MKVTIAPSAEALAAGQWSVTIERPDDDIPVVEIIEMFRAALIACGCDAESAQVAFEYCVERNAAAEIRTEDLAQC